MKQGFKDMATRAVRAYDEFIGSVATRGGISLDEAKAVYSIWAANRMLDTKDEFVGGVIRVKHGAMWDRETILFARDIANGSEPWPKGVKKPVAWM